MTVFFYSMIIMYLEYVSCVLWLVIAHISGSLTKSPLEERERVRMVLGCVADSGSTDSPSFLPPPILPVLKSQVLD